MNIDFTKISSAKDREDAVLLDRQIVAKAECKKRITAVLSETAQLNLIADAASGRLNEAQLDAYAEWLAWVEQMRAAWSLIPKESDTVHSDDFWPDVPDKISVLKRKS